MEGTERKLVVSGCSYTNYRWPTWADFLGAGFNTYINAGVSGGGNRVIYNNLLYLVRNNIITKDDLVIVQWSALSREDRMKTGDIFWTTPGNLDWQNEYSDEFVTKYFNVAQQALELLNYAESLKLIFKSIGCEFLMFNMFDWHVEDWFGEPSRPLTIHKQRDILTKLNLDDQLKDLSKSSLLSTSLDKFKLKNGQPEIYVNYYSEMPPHRQWSDPDDHPAPLTHLSYLLQIIAPEIRTLTDHEFKSINSTELKQLATRWNEWCSNEEAVRTETLSRHLNIYPEGLYWPSDVWTGGYISYKYLDMVLLGEPETKGKFKTSI